MDIIIFLVIIGGIMFLPKRQRRKCLRVDRNILLEKIKHYSKEKNCPELLTLVTAERESGIKNESYNKAYTAKRGWYAYKSLKNEHIKRNAGLKRWFEANPHKNEPSQWGSFGFLQVHPHWNYQNIPIGESHISYMCDVDFMLNIYCRKLAVMFNRFKNICDVRLRYLGWKTVAYYVGLYPIAKGKRKQDRNMEERKCITAIEKKIPANLRAYNRFKTRENEVPFFESKTVERMYKGLTK